jgi:hypothetical protein
VDAHQHVHRIVGIVVTHRLDRRFVEIALCAQYARGFIEQPVVVLVAGMEQQLILHGRVVGRDVQIVGDAVRRGEMRPRLENVVDLDLDVADARAALFELCITSDRCCMRAQRRE